MGRYRHDFTNTVESGSIVFGMSRELDERSLVAYLQRFTDDDVMKLLLGRFSDDEISGIVDYVSVLLRRHLSDEEYHLYFLKDSESP